MSTASRDDMSESEIAMRKFLKQLGVTAHQVLESALEEAVADGKIEADGQVPVVATVTTIDKAATVTAVITTAATSTSVAAAATATGTSTARKLWW